MAARTIIRYNAEIVKQKLKASRKPKKRSGEVLHLSEL